MMIQYMGDNIYMHMTSGYLLHKAKENVDRLAERPAQIT